MPGTFAALDQNLPRFTGGEDLERKVQLLQDYQYQLLEQLRYILGHLDTRNFNQTALSEWAGQITGPIYNKIKDTEGNLAELSATAQGLAAKISDAEGNIASLRVTAKGLESQVQDAKGNISSLQQTATAIQTTVSNQAGQISTLTQTAAGLQTAVSNQAGQISTLTQTAAGLQTTVSNQAGQISAVTQTINGLTVSVAGPYGSSQTMINGGSIYTDTLYLNSLYGENIYLWRSNGGLAASFTLQGASSYIGSKVLMSSGAIELQSSQGDVYLQALYGASLQVTSRGTVQVGGDLIPEANVRYNCGTSQYRWNDVYASNGPVTGSDRETKRDIDYDMSQYSGLFDRLRPCSFLRKDGTSGRRHHGLIAQDVLEAVKAEGMTGQDFAGYVEWKNAEKIECGLRYEELIAMLVHEVQQLKKRLPAKG